MIRTAAAFSLAVLISLAASTVRADTCDTTGRWVDAVVCDSEILKTLDLSVTDKTGRLVSHLTLATPALAAALEANQAAWQDARVSCKEAALPQQCMEWRYYARADTVAHLTGLLAGPRRFGDPLRVCWRNAEGEKDAQTCLDRRLADIRTGLGIIAEAVRGVLMKRDAGEGSEGDAVSTFDAAQAAFPPFAIAACRSEAAALGHGPGRALGQAACTIRAWQARAIDILRFLPGLPVHWSAKAQASQHDFARCLDHARKPGAGGPFRVSGFTILPDGRSTVRVADNNGARHDCTLTAADKSVESFEAVPREDIGIADGLAFFSTTGDGPVAQECFDHDRVYDPDGNPSGWMSYRIC